MKEEITEGKFRKWEVLKRWDIDGIKLAQYVCDGLYAYNRYGSSLPTIEDQAQALAFRYSEEEYLAYLADQIAWFIIDDVIDYEVVHGIAQHDTAPIPAALVPVVAKSADDHIKQRKTEGAKVEEIAFELYDRKGDFKLTYLEIARKLSLDKDLKPGQYDARKKRAERACQRGETMLVKSGKRKKS